MIPSKISREQQAGIPGLELRSQAQRGDITIQQSHSCKWQTLNQNSGFLSIGPELSSHPLASLQGPRSCKTQEHPPPPHTSLRHP